MWTILISSVLAQRRYPAGCAGPTFPNHTECIEKNWYLGPDARDRCAPIGPYPIWGEQVYIQDPRNFCFMLPDPNNVVLKQRFYDRGRLPTIVSGEGYAQAFCIGDYLTPGGMRMNPAAIKSAHVIKAIHTNGKKYIEISGLMDCGLLNISCESSTPGAFDDGGQYDAVPFINCGKGPYSGVDSFKHPGMVDYVEQAGNGEFCMRICEAGQMLEDPCNVKNDTAGCRATMGVDFKPGFSFVDRWGAQVTSLSFSTTATATSTKQESSTTSFVATSTSAAAPSSTTSSTSSALSDGFSMLLLLISFF